jgi:hypothetical protein
LNATRSGSPAKAYTWARRSDKSLRDFSWNKSITVVRTSTEDKLRADLAKVFEAES